MKKMKIAVIAAIAVLGLGALGGAAVRANAADTSPAPDPATTLSTAAEVPEADATTPDTDNVQLQDLRSAADRPSSPRPDTKPLLRAFWPGQKLRKA